MLKTTMKTFAAAVVATGCLTVAAEAGQKRGGHGGGHGMNVAHGGYHGGGSKVGHHGASMPMGRGHGQLPGYHHGGFAVGAGVRAIGGISHVGNYAYPAGKGCGPTYTYVAQPVARVAAVAHPVIVRSSPVCVCD